MRKPRCFIDIRAKSAQYRNIEERLKDFNEVEVLLSDDEIREQASPRCMDCGVPFCHGLSISAK